MISFRCLHSKHQGWDRCVDSCLKFWGIRHSLRFLAIFRFICRGFAESHPVSYLDTFVAYTNESNDLLDSPDEPNLMTTRTQTPPTVAPDPDSELTESCPMHRKKLWPQKVSCLLLTILAAFRAGALVGRWVGEVVLRSCNREPDECIRITSTKRIFYQVFFCHLEVRWSPA